jgi:hypothetical protein
MLEVLVQFVVLIIVLGLLYWVLTLLPLPEPLKQIVIVVAIIIFVLWLTSVLLGYAPAPPVRRR